MIAIKVSKNKHISRWVDQENLKNHEIKNWESKTIHKNKEDDL